MAKKKIIPKIPTTKKINLPDDKPVHLDMSFEEAIKKAATTQIKKKKQ